MMGTLQGKVVYVKKWSERLLIIRYNEPVNLEIGCIKYKVVPII